MYKRLLDEKNLGYLGDFGFDIKARTDLRLITICNPTAKMFTKFFFHAILVSLAISEISGMVRGKREAEDLQCPTSQIELSGTEWGM